MADFYVYDRNGRPSGHHKRPESAIAQAKELARKTGDFADVEKRQGHRRRFFVTGQVATIRKEGRATR